MKQKNILTIVRISEQLANGLYLTEDVFDGAEINVSITGKMRMIAFPALQPGDECIIQYYSADASRGGIITKTSLKGNQSVFGGYLDVRKRYEATFGPYTDDYSLIKRAT